MSAPSASSTGPVVRIPRRKPRTARIGLFGVGYHVYWGQFPGLLDELLAKLAILEGRVAATGATVTNFGIIDKAQDAYALLPKLKAADLELGLILNFGGRLMKDGLVRVLNPDKIKSLRGDDSAEHDTNS
jgi:hypothetical protein